MKIVVQQGQNIYDLARQYYGNTDGVYRIIADNAEVLTDIRSAIAPGTVLNITSAATNAVNVRRLQSRDESVAVNDKPQLTNDDNYVFDVWEDFSSVVANQVECITIIDGDVWVGTRSNGIFVYNGSTWTNYTTSNSDLSHNHVRWIMDDSANGYTYICTGGGGLDQLDLGALTWANWTTVDGLVHNNCTWVGRHNSKLYIATNGGVSETADLVSFTNYTSADPELASNTVRHGFVDANGDMWLSTAGGLSVWRLASGTVDLYDNAGGELPSDDVVHVFGYNGLIYVCTDGAGLVIYDGNNWITHDTSGPNAPNDEPLFMVNNSLGTVYCGFANVSNGVISIVRNRDSWSTEAASTTSDMPNSDVNCMAVDANDNIWVGTASLGLWYYNKNILING